MGKLISNNDIYENNNNNVNNNNKLNNLKLSRPYEQTDFFNNKYINIK